MKIDKNYGGLILIMILFVFAFILFVLNPVVIFCIEYLVNYVFTLNINLSYGQLVGLGILLMLLTNLIKVNIDYEHK